MQALRLSEDRKTGNNDNIQHLGLSYPDLANINAPEWNNRINQAKKVGYKRKTVLFSGTNACNSFLLVLKGTIRIYQTAADGRELTLYRVEAGDLCILTLNCLLRNQVFNAIAEAETDVSALLLSKGDFNYFMNVSQVFRNYIIDSLTDRLSYAMTLVSDSTFNNLHVRLACLLGGLFERGHTQSLDFTHQELAAELGTTREVISRILKKFENKDCIKLSRGKIELRSTEALNWFKTKE